MPKPNDCSRSVTAFEQNSTLIAVIEMSLSSWLVAGVVPGIERHPLKKLETDEDALLKLLLRWRDEAVKAGHKIERIAIAFEAGRDGFWLARWLRARGIEAYVIHPASVAVSREHRRAKTDRLDTELLKRVFLGWLRGEPDHCSMSAIPTLEQEDAKRPNRERENLVGQRTRIVNRMKACLIRFGIRNFKPTLRKAPEGLEALRTPEGAPLPPNTRAEMRRDITRLRFVQDQIKEIGATRLQQLEQAPAEEPHAMIRLLARVTGVGIETADMLVKEILARNLRDQKAVARYAGLTLTPDPKRGAGAFTLSGGTKGAAARPGPAEPEDVALILHTSGTTSRPKIVPLTQSNVVVSADNIARTLEFTEADRGLNILPLFHIHGLIAGLLAPLSRGGSVFCTPGFNALRFFASMAESGGSLQLSPWPSCGRGRRAAHGMSRLAAASRSQALRCSNAARP